MRGRSVARLTRAFFLLLWLCATMNTLDFCNGSRSAFLLPDFIVTYLSAIGAFLRRNVVKKLLIWLGVGVSALFLYSALSGLQLPMVWEAIKQANYWWVLPGVAIYFVGVWIRTWRWHYMLRQFKPVPVGRLFPVVCIGYAGNNIYPARAGEVIRSYVLKKKEAIPISGSLATVLIERIFDGLVMLLFVFLALPFTSGIPQQYRSFVVMLSAVFGVALILFIAIAIRPQWVTRLYTPVANKLIPARFRAKTDDIVERFLFGLASLQSPKDVLMMFFTTILIWLAETMKYWFVMHAFDFSVSFITLMLMNGIVNLFTTLPSAPGYIGTFDAPGIKVLVDVGAVGATLAAAYTLVLHAALWLPITLLGIYYFFHERLRWSDFEKATAAVQQEKKNERFENV
jgi:uncharacterized protein (TIRG00374 family)